VSRCDTELRPTVTKSLTKPGSVTITVENLQSGTSYEFRIVATTSSEQDRGSIQTFETLTGTSPPQVDVFDVSERGSPNPHAEIDAEWGPLTLTVTCRRSSCVSETSMGTKFGASRTT